MPRIENKDFREAEMSHFQCKIPVYSRSNNASAIFSTSKSRKVIDEQITKYENIAAITQ